MAPVGARSKPNRAGVSCDANVADASVDAKKSLRLIGEHSQRADHPVLITIPETGYLKGVTVEVIATR